MITITTEGAVSARIQFFLQKHALGIVCLVSPLSSTCIMVEFISTHCPDPDPSLIISFEQHFH